MRKTLLDIEYEYLQYLSELDEYCMENQVDSLEAVPDSIMERLTINRDEMEHKVENYLKFIAELEGEAKVLEEQVERLRTKAKKKAQTILYLKGMVSKAIELYGKTNQTGNTAIETATYKITRVRTNPVIVEDMSILPDQFKRCSLVLSSLTFTQFTALSQQLSDYAPKETVEPDKIAIKKALAEDVVPGAKVDTEAAYLRIS